MQPFYLLKMFSNICRVHVCSKKVDYIFVRTISVGSHKIFCLLIKKTKESRNKFSASKLLNGQIRKVPIYGSM